MNPQQTQTGVTLVELVVTIAVLAILVTMAAPSFADLAQRSALRGAADNVVAVVALAKEEAIKRDQMVRVDFKPVGAGFCVGAKVVASIGEAGCDCSAATCPLVSYPKETSDLHRVTLTGTPLFGTDSGFVIDPKTGMLVDFSDGGAIVLGTSHGTAASVRVNGMGRTSICTPGDKGLSGVQSC